MLHYLTTKCMTGYLNYEIIKESQIDVEWYIDHGADINNQIMTNRLTPLMYAISTSQDKLVQALINAGADIQLQDDSGWNALMYAVFHKNNEIVKTLLDLGANVHIRDTNGNSALMTAAYYGNKKAVKMLLNAGSNVNLKSANGNTAMNCATANEFMAIFRPDEQKNIVNLLNSAIEKANDELKEVIIHYPTDSETMEYTLLQLYNKSMDKPVSQQITDEMKKMTNDHFKKFQIGII